MASSGGYYSERSIESVRSATDIASVIGRYVSLKVSGRHAKGLCPFHREKTPSFFVSSERQMYHCFGCGAGGDVFSFMMNYLGFSFAEAVEELAAEAGIALEKSGKDTSRTDVFREILAESQRFYRQQFRNAGGKRARDYLSSRGFSSNAAETLGIGWAPDGSRLSDHLRGRSYSESHMIEAGVSLRSDRGGGAYDRFRSRLLFPIRDRRGRVVSFGGRLIGSAPENVPKYLNGPDSPVYRKGDYLYGYREAVSASRDLDMVILVEGYFDHARLVEAGFECTVATCGTALTSSQARQMAGMASSVFICYDGDRSGQRAAVRAAEIMLGQGCLPRVMAVPDGLDPDDYIRDRGGEGVLALAERAADPVRFALGLVGGWPSVSGTQKKVRVVRRLTGIASSASDPVTRETLLRVISEETGYSMGTLQLEIEQRAQGRSAGAADGDTGGNGLNRWDTRILGTILLSRDGLSDPLIAFLEEDDLRSGTAVSILSEMKRQAGSGTERFQFSGLDDSLKTLCARLLAMCPEVPDPSDAQRLRRAVERDRLHRERELLRSRLPSAEGEQLEDLLRRIKAIEKLVTSM